MELTQKGNPKIVILNCQWCNKEISTDWKHRKQKCCSYHCMYEYRKSLHWEKSICPNCKNEFLRRKNEKNGRTGLPRQYCSIPCYLHSDLRKEQSKKQNKKLGNPWVRESVKKKIKQTKLERHGNENYNNPEKYKQTCLEKYGVPTTFFLPNCKSNGKTISNPQKTVYDYIKRKYKKSEIEWYLSDIDKSVDIYVPEKNLVVEVYGDFWHCNPINYDGTFYHPFIKKYAKEIWKKDKNREKLIKSKYNLIKIWENEVNNEKYKSFFRKK